MRARPIETSGLVPGVQDSGPRPGNLKVPGSSLRPRIQSGRVCCWGNIITATPSARRPAGQDSVGGTDLPGVACGNHGKAGLLAWGGADRAGAGEVAGMALRAPCGCEKGQGTAHAGQRRGKEPQIQALRPCGSGCSATFSTRRWKAHQSGLWLPHSWRHGATPPGQVSPRALPLNLRTSSACSSGPPIGRRQRGREEKRAW